MRTLLVWYSKKSNRAWIYRTAAVALIVLEATGRITHNAAVSDLGALAGFLGVGVAVQNTPATPERVS